MPQLSKRIASACAALCCLVMPSAAGAYCAPPVFVDDIGDVLRYVSCVQDEAESERRDLQAQVDDLQGEMRDADDEIDDLLDRLEDAEARIDDLE